MPPQLTRPRLKRLVPDDKQYGKTTYRRAIKTLLGEAGGRCGYSLEHVLDFGLKTMEVDHFDPTLKHPRRNRHENLIAASRHCNGAKSENWPSKELQKQGVRFLNPYIESDYGVHIFENLETGELIGATPAGRWHIEMLDLNADHLIRKRLDRTKLSMELKRCAYCSGADHSNQVFEALTALLPTVHDTIYKKMIPPIPESRP
jgi:hypothetical protein